MVLSGWDIDLRAVYGDSLWKTRARLHLGEKLFESSDSTRGVLFFGIGEVGVNKQVARVALFEGKTAPRTLWRSGMTLFWFEGAPDEPIAFSGDRRTARLYQFVSGWRGELGWRERVLDLETGRLLPDPSSPGPLRFLSDAIQKLISKVLSV